MEREMTPNEQLIWDMAMDGEISMSKAIGWARADGLDELADLLRAS